MTARLRLFLAILVLALAPLLTPAGAVSAVPQSTVIGCDHPCDGMDHSDRTQTACSCGAAQLVLPSLAGGDTTAPVFVALGHSIPADISRASTRWPPPLRPPRA